MSSIVSASNLIFYKVEKYQYNISHTFDFSNCPRPHYCMGLILKGSAKFTDSSNNSVVEVNAGDIIFVPMGSRYISQWYGTPEVEYISIHFIFGTPGLFTKENNYRLQRVRLSDPDKFQKIFEFALDRSNGDDSEKLKILSEFYTVLAEIQPQLQKQKHSAPDAKILSSIRFIEQYYNQRITIDTLATNVQMSVSRFYPFFKKELGITPIDYINNYRISRAILLLMSEENHTIESISEQTGFESSAYFRRVFRKVTGLSPREYKKTSMEL